MPAKPLTAEQKADAARLRAIFENRQADDPSLTQESLAHTCGWRTQGTVNQYLNGKIPLNMSALLKFSRALQAKPADISPSLAAQMNEVAEAVAPNSRAYEAREPEAGYYNAEPAVTKGVLPLISWVQAGDWAEISDRFQPGDAEDWIPCPFNHGPNAFILRVAGSSMYNPGGDKSYAPGEYIAVDPRVEPQNKKMVVVRIDGQETATFKQLIVEPDGTYLLQALNPSWPNRIMQMPRDSRIVGVVIGKWTPE